MPKYDSPPSTTPYPVDDHHEATNTFAPTLPTSTKYGHTRPTSPSATMYNPFYTGRPRTPVTADARVGPIDRQEIIRKIKEAESCPLQSAVQGVQKPTKSRSPTPPSTCSDLSESDKTTQHVSDQNELGLDITRPRSALHRGDFRENAPASPWSFSTHNARVDIHQPARQPWRSLDGQDSYRAVYQKHQTPTSTSPVAPWARDFASPAFAPDLTELGSPPGPYAIPAPARPRAASHASLSTSFTYQLPTSPLVHQANAADIPDYHPRSSRRRLHSPTKAERRHTYSPRLLHQSRSELDSPSSPIPAASGYPATLRRESIFPYQAHQPRRSIGSFNSLPKTSFVAGRRPSLTDAPPLQHAPMVGSYEESILRGRMSTTPSKPLNFVAQIGVLGKGDCKSSLKCPPHISIPFNAVFYSYSAADPEPSPYVGAVDLEHAQTKFSIQDTSSKSQRRQSPGSTPSHAVDRIERDDPSGLEPSKYKRRKGRTRSRSPKEPQGGSYRIPQKGQVQIVLKNPNKTAVKLFLVPYDVSDMQPGQKTFIRQRSYSAGPIIDMPTASRTNYGTDRPEAALSATMDPRDRPRLRYLVQLHICCPSKNRYYIYQNIRVVFADRVPDGKEKLRSEIQMPEPRYSVYKSGRELNPGMSPANSSVRGKSVAFPAAPYSDDSHDESILSASVGSKSYRNTIDHQLFVKSLDHQPYRLSSVQRLPTLESRPSSRGLSSEDKTDSEAPQASVSPFSTFHKPKGLNIRNLAMDASGPTRLTFSREASRERKSGVKSESLLSMRLKDLEMREGANHSGGDDDVA